MTTYDVDVTELRAALAELAACQRDLIGLAADIDHTQEQLQARWAGRAADAQASSYGTWRAGCADMVTALARLRAIVAEADAHYSHAVEDNVAMWQQVSV